jgi:hypothetical protein
MIAGEAKGCQQRFQLHKHLVFASTKDIRQDLPAAVIDGMPQPPPVFLLPNNAPHLISFGFVDPAGHDVHVAWVYGA